MTRIIAGIAGGRRLAVPQAGTRPTADRVREALFSALLSRTDLTDAAVLDLFAGSGALGLEALSRGAREVLLVESDARAASVIAANIDAVGLPGARVRRAPVAAVLRGPPEQIFDIVFADPPYAISDRDVGQMLMDLQSGGWLAAGAVVVIERSARSPHTAWPQGLTASVSKRYGETRLDWAVHDSAVFDGAVFDGTGPDVSSPP